MAVLLEDIPWKEPFLPRHEVPELLQRAKRTLGYVPNILPYIAKNEWLVDGLMKGNRFAPVGVDRKLMPLCHLVVSQENSCRYCYGTARSFMKLSGYSDKAVDAIERDMELAELGTTERAAIEFCRKLARSNPRPAKPEYDALLGRGVSPYVAEFLAFQVAMGCFSNRIQTFLAAPIESDVEALPSKPIVKLFRPILAWAMSKAGEKLEPRTGPLQYAGPFALVFRAVEGVPWTPYLAETVDAAVRRNVLGERAAFLTFAVVSRGLSCPTCEGEACRRLEDGGLERGEIETILTHLDSGTLTREEGLLLRFARNTVRYQTAQMQDETRRLCEEIGPVATIDAVALCALANAIARLAMLLHCR